MLWIANILPCSLTTYPWHTLDLQKLVRLKEEYRTANYAMKFSDHHFNSIVIPPYQVNAHSIDSEHFHKFETLKSKTLQDSKDPNKTIVKMHAFSSFVQRMSVWSCAKTIRTNPFNFAQQGLQWVKVGFEFPATQLLPNKYQQIQNSQKTSSDDHPLRCKRRWASAHLVAKMWNFRIKAKEKTAKISAKGLTEDCKCSRLRCTCKTSFLRRNKRHKLA